MTFPVFLAALHLALGLTIFLLGLVILRENARSPVHRATAAMLCAGALGSLLAAVGRIVELGTPTTGEPVDVRYLRSFAYLWEFFFPSLLYFALVYPWPRLAARRLLGLEVALYVPHACHLALVLFSETLRSTTPLDALTTQVGPGLWGDLVAVGLQVLDALVVVLLRVHQPLFALVNLAYASVAVGLLARSRARIASARVRGQVAVVLVGLSLCVLGYAFAKLLPILFPWQPSGALESVSTSLALLVASAAIAVAIVRHRFLDMQQLARRSILYGAAALAFAGLYVVVMRQVQRLGTGLGPGAEAIEAGFMVLLVIAFEPLLTAIETGLENLLRRRTSGDPRSIAGDLARGLGAELDVEGLRRRVATQLRGGLLVRDTHLWTLEDDGDDLALCSGDDRQRITATSPLQHLIRFLESTPGPVPRLDLHRSFANLPTVERDAVRAWTGDWSFLVSIPVQGRVRGILAVGPKLTGGRFHREDLSLLDLLSHQIAVSLENLRLLSENVQKRILEEEIGLASEIQRGLLPKSVPLLAAYCTHAVSFQSKLVGGDYYDLFVIDGRLHVVIADVAGKGVPAALLMASLRAALHSHVAHETSPAAVLSRLNALLFESTAIGKFATLFYATLDLETHEIVYANAGHNYPIVIAADGSCCELTDGGIVLGILPSVDYADGRLMLAAGETLFLYTDGITEATAGSHDEEFGTPRLQATLTTHCGVEPVGLVHQVLQAVRGFTGGADPEDDLTVLVLRRDDGIRIEGPSGL